MGRRRLGTVALVESTTLAAPPAPQLRRWVSGYLGYRLLGHPAGIHRGLPSRHLTFIVSIGPPIDVVSQVDRHQPPSRYRAVLGGLQDGHALIAHDGDQEGVGIDLTPLGCRALLGVPARELWNTSLEAEVVAGRAGDELWERLQGTSGWAERFATCDDVLGRLLRDVPVRPELEAAWGLLVTSGGNAPVAEVADAVGWSRRHLTHRFTQELGLSPKAAARVVRFERARRLLGSPSRPSLAEVAAACGYHDQPHLTRDFTTFAGCPPGRWLAEEVLPSVQDGGGVDPAPSDPWTNEPPTSTGPTSGPS